MIKNEIKIADDWAKFEELLAKLNKLIINYIEED